MSQPEAKNRGIQLVHWGAVGVCGGAVVGIAEAALLQERMLQVLATSPLINGALKFVVAAVFYSQLFAAVLLAAGAFFLFVSPWPRRPLGYTRSGRLATSVFWVAAAGMYAGMAVNAWAPGARSWQSLVGNGGLLFGALIAVAILYWLLAFVPDRLWRGRGSVIVAVVIEATALVVLASFGVFQNPAVPDEGRGSVTGPNIVLITVDTLRADHLSSYGYDRIQTPNIDAVGRDGARFSHHVAATSWTLPSLASLHTGTYPDVHGTISSDRRINPNFVTLAEVLRERGYLTGAFLTNAYFDRKFGFDQGFAVYNHARDHASDPVFAGLSLYRFLFPMHEVRHAAGPVTDRVVDFLGRARDRRFFIWVHYIDPHLPYGDWYLDRLPDYARDLQVTRGATIRNIDPYLDRQKEPTADDIRHLNGAYDAEILYVDGQIGRLRDALDRLGLSDDTLVVLTGDHGEEFFDHGYLFHGHTLFNEVVRVPLLATWPGRIKPGTQIDAPCGTVDLSPTLLELAGAATPPGYVGRSLAPLLTGGVDEGGSRFVFSMLDKNRKILNGVHTEQWDLLLDALGGSVQLFDAQRDPKQKVNVAAEHDEVVAELRARLAAWQEEAERFVTELPHDSDNQIELDPETVRALRGLGYLN